MMDAHSVSEAGSLPATAADLFPRPAVRPAGPPRVITPFAKGLALAALLLAGGALAVLQVGGQATPLPAIDMAALPTPAGLSPVPVDATEAVLGLPLTNPSERVWTTAEDPFEALGAMIATLKGAGWTLEGGPAGGLLPGLPHLARLGRPGAQLFVSAWRGPADLLTRVVAVLEP